MIHSLYLNWISLKRYSSFWNHLIVRNLILVFGLGSTFSSCEEDMIYEFATTSISSSDYEVCSYDQCPEVSLAYVEFNTPELLGKEVNKDIESLLMEQLIVEGQTASSIKEALELYLSNAQNSYPEGSVFSAAHELQIAIDVVYSSNDVLTLQNDYYEFAGGAHGVGGVSYWNYNPKTGQKWENAALFSDLEGFKAFAKEEFIKTYGSLDKFWFEDEVFTLPTNIGFTQEVLILFYNVYEIAPYSEGTFQLNLKRKDVEKYLSF